MDAFCPGCGANVGFGTIQIIGCPLCGYGEDQLDDDLDDLDDDNDDLDDDEEDEYDDDFDDDEEDE